MSASSSSPTATPKIPLPYRLMFHWFEPIMAGLGALQAVAAPSDIVRLTLPSLHGRTVSPPPSSDMTTALVPLLTHSAGSWAMLSLHDAVTLRVFATDVRVWSLVLGAALLSDVGYTVGLVQSMGVAGFFDVRTWGVERAFVVLSTIVPMAFKVGFLMRVGLRHNAPSKKRV